MTAKLGRLKRSLGFSLLELMVSLTLSTVVLIGVISIATQVVRNQFQTIRSGEISGQTLAALHAMNRELEQATYIDPTAPTTSGDDIVSGCLNYSPQMVTLNGDGRIDSTKPIQSFYYCVLVHGTPGRFDSLLRYPPFGQYGATCPITTPTCGAGSYDAVVGYNFSKIGSSSYFTRDDTTGGISMNYIVGNATPTAQVKIPVAYIVQSKITMAKSYLSGD
jgi:hypothetical protein